ncbi:MAG TPA: hypothetical protein PK395_21370, partial [bacterium]|nr:hypothetical protein [bacterium]
FSLSKILLTVLPGDTLRASYLRLMTRLSNWMIRRNGGRLPTHWHQPRFIEDLIRHSHREYPKTTE